MVVRFIMQPHERNVVASNPGGVVVPRDTHSIPGVSMYAQQWYPSTFFKHEELVANKELFFEALNKFHTVLGTRLTYASFQVLITLFPCNPPIVLQGDEYF